jgi:hypothetical protein
MNVELEIKVSYFEPGFLWNRARFVQKLIKNEGILRPRILIFGFKLPNNL